MDEPEVYLHPDLQRKLVHLLEDTERQIILATHSSEVTAEADPRLVMLVEKGARRARRARDDADLELLSSALGTAFNLRLAKALRSKVVLFVEGQDMVILKRLAKTLDLSAVATENGVTVIALEGYSHWGEVGPFAWLCRSLLPEAIKIFVVLDHDYRPEKVSRDVEKSLSAEGVSAHVWHRKELESYLLTPSVLARVSGSTVEEINSDLDQITLSMEDDVFGKMLHERIKMEKSAQRHETMIMADFKKEFDSNWKDRQFRLSSCPPKRIVSELNNLLKQKDRRTLSMRSLATAHRLSEIPAEMISLLKQVDEATLEQKRIDT
jgi:predicted ATP-dependent endonuclease of OLD family